MTRVLLFAYHFPPLGGPTTQRTLSFVRHLPAWGYEPIVLTASGSTEDFWSPYDSTGERQLPDGLSVKRVSVPQSNARRARIERLLALPSSFARQFEEAASHAAAGFAGQIDVMICVFGLYDLGHTASRIARELAVPWVADLQDPWALDEMWLYPTAFHRMIDRRRMREVLMDASAVIMNTAEAGRRVRAAFPDLAGARVHSVPNGFNAEDFSSAPPSREGVFRIVHTGSLHTLQGLHHRRTAWRRRLLGGMPVSGVDFLTRSHVFLLEAVSRVLDADPSLAQTLEVHFVGPMTDVDLEIAERSPVSRVHGVLSHLETVAMLRTADLLFLPMQDLPRGVRAGLVPTKAYEYAASARAILAAVPEGDARDFLGELGTATIVDPADVSAMERAILTAYAGWRRGDPLPPVNSDVLAKFEYGQLAGSVASILDDVLLRT